MDSTCRSTLRRPQKRAALSRFFLSLLALGLLFVSPQRAWAAGSVSLQTNSPEEINGKWKLFFTINYGGKPDVAYVPMIFSFTPTSITERSLTDQSPEKPVITRLPLKGQVAINESMDVGFSNPSGGVFTTTKFDFVIRRDKGFEAGEYDLKITRTNDGAQMGNTIKLTLKGENPIVDRRAIVFAGNKKKTDEKKTEGATDEKKEGEGTSEAAPTGDSAGAPPPADETPTEAPPAVEPETRWLRLQRCGHEREHALGRRARACLWCCGRCPTSTFFPRLSGRFARLGASRK
jgi:hypothetical protein